MHESYSEIFEQHVSLKKTFEHILSKKDDIIRLFDAAECDEVVFVACGSSFWLGTSACITFQQRTGIRCSAVMGGDVIMNKQHYCQAYKNPLIIAPSRSGNTTELLQAIVILKEAYGSRVVSLVEYADSPIQTLSDLSLELPWANENSVCQTRSFSNLYLASVMLGSIVGRDNQLIRELDRYLTEAASLMKEAEETLNRIIREFPLCLSLVTLGNGVQLGVSSEGAYICIEMAQFSSNYYATLELRHGPIVMLDETCLVGLFSGGNGRPYEEGMAAEAIGKGARVMSISGEDDFQNATYRFSLGWHAQPEIIALYGVYVLQGFAFLKAVDKELDPDNPKELVAWIKL